MIIIIIVSKSVFHVDYNIKFIDWDRDALEAGLEVSGPIEAVTAEEVRAAIGKMKSYRGSGPSGLVADVLKAAGGVGVNWMTDVCNAVMTEGNIPSDWCKRWMVTVFKGKGDALECSSYRGIKLLEHGMKVFKRVLEARLRRNVVIDDMQFGSGNIHSQTVAGEVSGKKQGTMDGLC